MDDEEFASADAGAILLRMYSLTRVSHDKRKVCLMLCAFCRLVSDLLSIYHIRLIRTCELRVDGKLPADTHPSARASIDTYTARYTNQPGSGFSDQDTLINNLMLATLSWGMIDWDFVRRIATRVVALRRDVRSRHVGIDRYDMPAMRDVIACVFGNPWRAPVEDGLLANKWWRPVGSDQCTLIFSGTMLEANAGRIISIAKTIYEGKDFDSMPILADALEEAGCTDQKLLDHCRKGPHVHGCHVLDMILQGR